MAKDRTVAGRLRTVFEALGIDLPIALRGWDGSRSGPTDAPALVIRHPRALRRLLWQPNQLGLGRAWVAGELSIEGDLYQALHRLDSILTMPAGDAPKPTDALRSGVLRDLVALGAIGPQPAPPPEEARLSGTRHSLRRDRRAISHHYDVGNDFYRLVLGPSLEDRSLRSPLLGVIRGGPVQSIDPAIEAAVDHQITTGRAHHARGFRSVGVGVTREPRVDDDPPPLPPTSGGANRRQDPGGGSVVARVPHAK